MAEGVGRAVGGEKGRNALGRKKKERNKRKKRIGRKEKEEKK